MKKSRAELEEFAERIWQVIMARVGLKYARQVLMILTRRYKEEKYRREKGGVKDK